MAGGPPGSRAFAIEKGEVSNMSRKAEIMKDAGFYTLTSYGAQAFDMVNAVFTRRFLGPASMGVWTFLQVILNYAKHASLGTTIATARDVPYYLGKGDTHKANLIKNLVFTFTVTTSLLLAGGIMAFAFFRRAYYPKEIIIGLGVVAVLVVLQRVYNLYIVMLRAHKQFFLAGVTNLLSSVASVFLTVALVWKFGLYGLFASILLNYLLLIAWTHVKSPQRFHFFFSIKEMVPIWTFGGAMLITDILNTVFASADRIMIAKYLGFEALGIYSVALMAFNYLNSVPTMLAVILFPHFQEVFSKKDDPRDLAKFLHHSSFSIAYLYPVLIGLVWIVSVYMVPLVLPKYLNGMIALKFLCLTAFFYGLRFSFNAFMITIKKHWLLVPLNIVLVVLSFGTIWTCIKCGQGINGVAFAVFLISVVNFFLFSYFSLKEIQGRRDMLVFYGKIMGLFCYFSAVLFAIEGVSPMVPVGWLRAVLALLVYGFAMIPLCYFAERELQLFSIIKDIFRRKFPKVSDAATDEDPAQGL